MVTQVLIIGCECNQVGVQMKVFLYQRDYKEF